MFIEKSFRNELPQEPGCYLFYDKCGNIIYIGKSKNIKKRVASYFNHVHKNHDKTEQLVRAITHIRVILTETETEALLLECDLIKEHKPKFNRMLIRDRVFYYLSIDLNADFPTLRITTNPLPEQRNFGCFYSLSDVEHTLELIGDVFKLPVCGKKLPSKQGESCLRMHIGGCMGPCNGLFDSKVYNDRLYEAISFLEGGNDSILTKLWESFEIAMKEQEYEKAKALHTQINQISILKNRRCRLNNYIEGKAAYIFFRAFNDTSFKLFYVDNDNIVGEKGYPISEKVPDFAKFITACQQGNSNSTQKIKNVLEISADKFFVVDPKTSSYKTCKRLKDQYKAWLQIAK